MSELRQLCVVRDYDELIDAVRGQVARLNLSCTTIDAVSGVQSGYAGKLLCDPPVKGLGRTSMGPILQTLGLCLIVAVDDDALKKLTPRLDERHLNGPKRGITTEAPLEIRLSRTKLKRAQRKGGKNRALNLTPKQRSRSARKASRARWRKERRRRRARRRAEIAAKRALVPQIAPCGSLSLQTVSKGA